MIGGDNMSEQTTTATPKKNTKLRAIIVIAFLIAFTIFTYISFRADYLEILEIGSQYENIFWQNIKSKYNIIGINFVVAFLAIYITNKLIKSGLNFFKSFIVLSSFTKLSPSFLGGNTSNDNVFLFFNISLILIHSPKLNISRYTQCIMLF